MYYFASKAITTAYKLILKQGKLSWVALRPRLGLPMIRFSTGLFIRLKM